MAGVLHETDFAVYINPIANIMAADTEVCDSWQLLLSGLGLEDRTSDLKNKLRDRPFRVFFVELLQIWQSVRGSECSISKLQKVLLLNKFTSTSEKVSKLQAFRPPSPKIGKAVSITIKYFLVPIVVIVTYSMSCVVLNAEPKKTTPEIPPTRQTHVVNFDARSVGSIVATFTLSTASTQDYNDLGTELGKHFRSPKFQHSLPDTDFASDVFNAAILLRKVFEKHLPGEVKQSCQEAYDLLPPSVKNILGRTVYLKNKWDEFMYIPGAGLSFLSMLAGLAHERQICTWCDNQIPFPEAKMVFEHVRENKFYIKFYDSNLYLSTRARADNLVQRFVSGMSTRDLWTVHLMSDLDSTIRISNSDNEGLYSCPRTFKLDAYTRRSVFVYIGIDEKDDTFNWKVSSWTP